MPATSFLLRILLRFRRVRSWQDGLNRKFNIRLLGADADDEKLWFQLKWNLKHNLKHYYIKPFVKRFFNTRQVRFFKTREIQFKTVVVRFRLRTVEPVKPAKKYLIALTGVPASSAAAERCIRSAKRYGEDDGLEIFPGIDQHEARDFFTRHGLTQTSPHRSLDGVAGCFASHYSLWLRCIESGEPIIVLEHDAVFRAPVPPLRFKHVITLSANKRCGMYEFFPALDRFEGREVFHLWPCLPGTCCYAIKPEGARKLVDAASRRFVPAVDVFMGKGNVNLLYYHPSPVAVDDRFSLIAE